MTLKEKAGFLKSQLKTGKENATTIKELTEKTGLTTRDINDAIRYLRMTGVIVCGDRREGKGVYIASNLTEAGESIATLKAQATSIYEVAAAMEQATLEAFSKSSQLDILNELRR